MTDDPRDILRAAGVEVPEVEAFLDDMVPEPGFDVWLSGEGVSDLWAAFTSLARLVAKYKWQRDWALEGWCCTEETIPERIAVTEAAYGDRPYRVFPWNHKMNGHVDCDCALCHDMEGVDDETYYRDIAKRKGSDS